MQLTNAHINSGGDVEKRKAFVRQANTFAGTFGLEVIGIGLVTFGSIAEPVGGVPTTPAGVTFLRVRHPALLQGFAGATYSATYHQLVSIPFSLNFNGQPFCAATFSDGNTFFYYGYSEVGGIQQMTAIAESYMGLVLVKAAGPTITTSTDLANQLKGLITTYLSEFTATNSTPTIVVVQSPPDVTFEADVTNEPTANAAALVDSTIALGYPGTGASAFAAFNIATTGTTSQWTVTSSIGPTQLYQNTIATTSPGAVAAAIVATINAATTTTGYSALLAGTSTVYIYFPLTLGATANGATITVTYTNTGSFGTVDTQELTLLGMSVGGGATQTGDVKVTTTKGGAISFGQKSPPMTSPQVKLFVSGGTAPYKFNWVQTSLTPASTTAISVSSTTAQQISCSTSGVVYAQPQSATYVCTVTDALQKTVVSANLTFRFTFT